MSGYLWDENQLDVPELDNLFLEMKPSTDCFSQVLDDVTRASVFLAFWNHLFGC